MKIGLTDGLVGFGIGYAYTKEKKRESEIKQGKNYYISCYPVIKQLNQLSSFVLNLNQRLPKNSLKSSSTVPLLCHVIPLIGHLYFPFCAIVKQGDYEKASKIYNKSKYAYIQLPKKLSGRSVAFFSYFAEHSGDVMRAAMITTSVSLIALGYGTLGGSALASMGYEILDQKGFIPRRISLLIETYMPFLSCVGALIGGSTLLRAYSAIDLALHIHPKLTFYLHQKIDEFARPLLNRFKKCKGATIKEIDAPVIAPKELSFEEIQKIINPHWTEFERIYKVNPAHCSKMAIDLDQFPKDHHFGKFLTLFKTIKWKSNLIIKTLRDDDRFLAFLFEKFPAISKETVAKDVEVYIEKLAKKDKITSAEYALNWTQEQMVGLTEGLLGIKPVEGSQLELQDAIYFCSILLPYYSSLKNPVELEDALLKLAVEGGNYCAKQLKRTGRELVWGIIQHGLLQQNNSTSDENKNYEVELMQALQNKRYAIFEASYQYTAQRLVPNKVSQDVHGYDFTRQFLSLGFMPMTPNERYQMGPPEIAGWILFSEKRDEMYRDYQSGGLDQAIHDTGELAFSIYLRQMILKNQRLTEQQKEDLLEKFTECNNGTWTYKDTLEKFRRYLCVQLGILIPCKPKY